jgi:hypothetical protein
MVYGGATAPLGPVLGDGHPYVLRRTNSDPASANNGRGRATMMVRPATQEGASHALLKSGTRRWQPLVRVPGVVVVFVVSCPCAAHTATAPSIL